ncbi:MAG: prepilin-type N-terminal cleavage/methylation domain-containing protein [Candidatus Omnitrophota bacterium]
MWRKRLDQRGFTLTEIMFVVMVSVVIIGSVTSAWVFIYKTWVEKSDETQLRVDLMKALEIIKRDIRRSSLRYMSFYPEGETTYSAISMPLADTDAGGFLKLNADEEIEWDKTVIYHVLSGENGTATLRRTVYDPRDNDLTDAERYKQLENTVARGEGTRGSTTDKNFLRNLETFTVDPLALLFDFYDESETPVKVDRITFGEARLSAGDHTIRFEIDGKNPASSGYGIGIDNIIITPCGSWREAEYYNSSFASAGSLTVAGGTAKRVYDPVWENNNYLEFQAGGIGAYAEFKDYYDLWRESSFNSATLDNTTKAGEEVHVELDVPQDGVEAREIAWSAGAETGDAEPDGRDGTLPTCPIVIRTIVENGFIIDDAELIRVKFRSSSENPLKISAAYIMRRKRREDTDGLTNQSPSGKDISEYHWHQQLFFKDSYDMKTPTGAEDLLEEVYIPANSEVWSEWTAFPLVQKDRSNRDVDYMISVYIPELKDVEFPSEFQKFRDSQPDSRYWQGERDLSFYVKDDDIDSDAHGIEIAGTPSWSTKLGIKRKGRDYWGDDRIFIVEEIDTWKKTGTVESQIFDTARASPAYDKIKWSQDRPTGTQIRLKARSSADADMDGTRDWEHISGRTSNPHSLSIGNQRYVQFLAELSAGLLWESSGAQLNYDRYVQTQLQGDPYIFPRDASGVLYATGVRYPWLDDVQINWPGERRTSCVVSGYVARKNDYGRAKVLIDGEEVTKILSVTAKVSTEIRGKTLEIGNTIEVEPKNTGK